MKIHNFNPGPAILPDSVKAEAAQSILDYKNKGISILELSHRAPDVTDVFDEATALVYDILGISINDYEVLWLSGGASAQLFMVPMNFLNKNQTAAYVDSGYWGLKAIEAAQPFGKINVIASSKETNYDRIPKNFIIPNRVQYLYLITNNTIDGTQLHYLPEAHVPLVCDMTSDFMSREILLQNTGVIFASAQKNIGSTGCTCVIIRKDMFERKITRIIPKLLNYKTHIAAKSLYHTPPVFSVYLSMLTMRWIKLQGGLKGMEKRNHEKATILYQEIDRNPLFIGSVVREDRSEMNVCFRMTSPDMETEFLKFAEQNGIMGIKGFASVGGFRASLYNAMPIESVQYLTGLMQSFSTKHANVLNQEKNQSV